MEMKPIPSYGDLMTLQDWIDCVVLGCFIDYDGHGCYATETEMSDIVVHPSDFPNIDRKWTHVVWFNR